MSAFYKKYEKWGRKSIKNDFTAKAMKITAYFSVLWLK